MTIEAKVCGWTNVSFCFVFLAKNSYVARKRPKRPLPMLSCCLIKTCSRGDYRIALDLLELVGLVDKVVTAVGTPYGVRTVKSVISSSSSHSPIRPFARQVVQHTTYLDTRIVFNSQAVENVLLGRWAKAVRAQRRRVWCSTLSWDETMTTSAVRILMIEQHSWYIPGGLSRLRRAGSSQGFHLQVLLRVRKRDRLF